MILRAFTHEFNRLEVAEQDYRMAAVAFRAALMGYDGTDPGSRHALDAAADRRSAAWDVWWALKRGY